MTSGVIARRTLAAVLGAGLLVSVAACGDDSGPGTSGSASTSPTITASPPADAAASFRYEGRDGATALDLLLEADPSAQVTGTGEQAFVTAINGREADSTKEFWALSVNGQMSTVGAESLQTKSGDVIEWKITEFTS